jgi:pyruvate, water dikinase
MSGTPVGPESVSTGLPGLDSVLDGLRIGDNVVWRIEEIEDYRRFVTPFVAAAVARERSIIYLRFGHHAPLIAPGPSIRIIEIDALQGFEAFTRHVYRLITDHGRGRLLCFRLSLRSALGLGDRSDGRQSIPRGLSLSV